MRYLLSGDLHIWDFKPYNLEPGYRLKQFIRVAQWWKDLVEYYDLDAILVAGDLVHQPSLPPKVLLTALDFFRLIPVPIINTHGQHDLDVRSSGQDLKSQSILSVFSKIYDHFIYLDGEYYRLGEDLLYGWGWRPELSWPELDPWPDLLIAHGSVRQASFGEIPAVASGYDPEAVPVKKLALVGDIHKAQRIGKVLIPGPPIHHSYSDSSSGVYLYDSGKDELLRVESGYVGEKRVYSFLQLLIDESLHHGEQEIDPQHLIVRRAPRRPVSIDRHKIDSDWREALNQLLEKEGLSHIHKRLAQDISLDRGLPKGDFRLRGVEIKNFRSIRELKMEFPSGLITIVGPNGSGKSSLLEAIYWAIYGGENNIAHLHKGEREFHVLLEIEQEDHLYTIHRSWKDRQVLRIYQDGHELDAPSLKRKESILSEIFPWMEWWPQLAFHRQFRHGLLSGMSIPERVELISKIYGLDHISQLYDRAKEIRSEVYARYKHYKQQAHLRERLAFLEGEISARSISPESLESEKQVLQEKEAFLSGKESLWRQLRERYIYMDSERRRYSNQIPDLKREMERIRDSVCPRCGRPLDPEERSRLQQELQSRMEEAQEKLESLQAKLSRLQSEIKRLEEELQEEKAELEVWSRTLREREDLYREYRWILSALQEDYGDVEEELRAWEKYLELLSPTGIGMRIVLSQIAQELSNSIWRVELDRQISGGKSKPHFSLSYKVGENWVDYESLSGGQRILLDLFFLSKLLQPLEKVGLMVFDETFSHMDTAHLESALDILESQLPAETIFVVSHHDLSKGHILQVRMHGGVSYYEAGW